MEYAIIGLIVLAVLYWTVRKRKKKKEPEAIPDKREEKPQEEPTHIVVTVPTEEKGYIAKDGVKSEVTIKYMPQGLQVFDKDGKCTLDLTDRLTRVVDILYSNINNYNEEDNNNVSQKTYTCLPGDIFWVETVYPDDVNGNTDGGSKVYITGVDSSLAHIERTSQTQYTLYYPTKHSRNIIVGCLS